MIITILVVTVISSCTTTIEPTDSLNPKRISTRALLDASPLAAGVELPDLSHIEVLELSPLMIDFNMYDFRSSYDLHIVSDSRGRAQLNPVVSFSNLICVY